MASSATEWAWRESRASNGSLIVLLAIADEIDREGVAVEMSVMQIARKSRLGDRATRAALKDLERLGELSVIPRAGGIGRYSLTVDTPAESAGPPRQNLPPGKNCTPADTAGAVDNPPEKPQVSGTPAKSAGPNFSNDLDLGSVVSGRRSKPSTSELPRDDVERLCQHLAERVIANGCRPPSITRKWRDAARLLIDKDGISEDRIHLAIDWSTRDPFWHRNILSMPKLREQYDKLQLAAQDEQRRKSQQPRNGHQPTNDDYEALLSNWARPLDAMEAGNDPRGNDRPGEVHRRGLPAAEDATGDGDRLV